MKIIFTFFFAAFIASCSKMVFFPDEKYAKLYKDKSYICNNPQSGNIYSLPKASCEQQNQYQPVVMPQAQMPVNQMPSQQYMQMPAQAQFESQLQKDIQGQMQMNYQTQQAPIQIPNPNTPR